MDDYNDWPEWKRAAWGFPTQSKPLSWEDFTDESEEVTEPNTTEINIEHVPVDELLDWMTDKSVQWDTQPTIKYECEELWDQHPQPTKFVRTHTQPRVRTSHHGLFETRDVQPIIDGRKIPNTDLNGDKGKP